MSARAILLTRPLKQSQAMAAALRKKNLPSFIEPMLEIAMIPAQAELASALAKNPAAILTTSQHALAALAPRPSPLAPLWTVGEASARRARAMGFSSVHSGGGSAAAMAQKIISALDPATGPLLYLRGASVAFDLTATLAARGFTVQEITVYAARARQSFSAELQAMLRNREIFAATFFSVRTLAVFSRLVAQHRLSESLREVEAVCLSSAIAERAGALPWKNIRTAKRASQRGVIAALAR